MTVQPLLTGAHLADAQIERILTSSRPTRAQVIGPAGSGKTAALEFVRDGLDDRGVETHTLAPNLLAAGMVLGVMGLVGIPLDIMTITIAAIVVGIGVDDCIHYVHRFLLEYPIDRNYRATVVRCHNSIGRAMYYTTVTIVVGFSMLTLSSFTPSIYFGLLTVMAMVAAVLGALLLLPLLLLLVKPLGPESG